MTTRETEAWRLGLAAFGEAFTRAQEVHGDAIPCRRGCSSCCESAAIFEIHAPDAALLREGMSAAQPERRDAIAERARAVVQLLRESAGHLAAEGEPLLVGWQPEAGFIGLTPAVVEALARRVESLGPGGKAPACPVLEPGGSCGLHDFRPAICRLQGVAWRDPATGAELPDFCTLEPRMASLRPVDAPLHVLDELREQLRVRLARAGESPARTCVAAALIAPPGPSAGSA